MIRIYRKFERMGKGPDVRRLKRMTKRAGWPGREDRGYVILLLMDSPEQLEIYSMRQYVLQKCYQRDGFCIASAESLDDCIGYVFRLSKQVYRETGGLFLRDYLLSEIKESYGH